MGRKLAIDLEMPVSDWDQNSPMSVSDLCKELGIERVTLYRYVGPKGELRDYGKRVLGLA